MRPFLAQFSEPVWSGHLPSWADFITTTPVFRFSVHTAGWFGQSVTDRILRPFGLLQYYDRIAIELTSRVRHPKCRDVRLRIWTPRRASSCCARLTERRLGNSQRIFRSWKASNPSNRLAAAALFSQADENDPDKQTGSACQT
jgi:hypothetical protein